MSNCIQKEDALNYLSGNMPGQEADRIKAHLLECERCRKLLDDGLTPNEPFNVSNKSGIDPLRTESISTQPEIHFQKTHSFILESLTDGYSVIKELSRGGQAVVYKATQKSTRRMVVVKILPGGAKASKRARYRFEREIELAASLQHPNIVTIFDSGITEGKYFYAMEYIEGLPLDDYIKTYNLSQNEIMDVFEKIASATAYAHQHGIIHRDLKPANILVDKSRQPHILDFGLSKIVDSMQNNFEGSVMTSIEGEILGTVAYMSPEQAAGKSDSIDIRTDVYSIGVMLYQAFTKVFPYSIIGSLLEILKNIQTIEPEKPSKIVGGIDSDIEAITLKALSKEPEARYQSASELAKDIRCFLQGLPISAKSESSIYVLKKLLRKHRYASMIFALLMIIVLGFSLISSYLYTREREAVKDLEVARDELSIEMQSLVQYGTNRVFIDFLLSWHQGHISPYTSFITEAKQKRAIEFLNDKTETSARIKKYLEQTSKNNMWFACFIVAELHYKNDNYTEAKEHYLKSQQLLENLSFEEKAKNDSYSRFIKARLYELTSE